MVDPLIVVLCVLCVLRLYLARRLFVISNTLPPYVWNSLTNRASEMAITEKNEYVAAISLITNVGMKPMLDAPR